MEHVLVDQKPMTVFRTFIAALVVFSVAALPASGQTIVMPLPHETIMGAQADMPCCPDCDIQDEFNESSCILKCAALAGAIVPATIVVPPRAVVAMALLPTADRLHGHLTAPPSHPPPG
jgi:hypothetical protein